MNSIVAAALKQNRFFHVCDHEFMAQKRFSRFVRLASVCQQSLQASYLPRPAPIQTEMLSQFEIKSEIDAFHRTIIPLRGLRRVVRMILSVFLRK